ncbi:hypothetical protein [Streptomyces sp. SYP-A7185]|uniref:hypothetical protein n=1 Tax=Streptomyces sp. SYP-A7185 TaxID=3040076 RepID=UPI0038F6493F
MGDIAKGALGGAWTLMVGWILPTALNLAVLLVAVAPSLRGVGVLDQLQPQTRVGTGVLLTTGALLLGLVAYACQNLLYRLLEGYLLWPAPLYAAGCKRSRRTKARLTDRLTVLRLERRRSEQGALSAEAADQLARLCAQPYLARRVPRDRRRTAAQRALLREQLARYPIADDEMAPTRLGNAIRRFEEYGWDRYRLDTQVLWNELTGCLPDQVRRQVELARTSVDFFITLLYGHLAVIALAAIALTSSERADRPLLLSTITVLALLVPAWYRSAVSSTDEWAAAVRAMVNIGRKPLAQALGLLLPDTIDAERKMWTMVSRLSRIPYHERAAALDVYRAGETGWPDGMTLPGPATPPGAPGSP